MTPSKISQKVAAGKIELVEQNIQRIKDLDLHPREAFLDEEINAAAGESCLLRALEAMLDLGRHILARAFGVAVVEYEEVGPKLAENDVLTKTLAEKLSKKGRYRNRLVHMYYEVTPEELHEVFTNELADLEEIAEFIKYWMAANPGKVDTSL